MTVLIHFLALMMGEVVFLTSVYFLSRPFREAAIKFAFRLLRAGIERVYKDQEAARDDIESEFKQSDHIKILMSKAGSLTSDQGFLNFLLSEKPYPQVQVLLANPYLDDGPAAQRARELSKGGIPITEEEYLERVFSSIDALLPPRRKNPKADCHLYSSFPTFRLMMCELVLFLSYYPPNRPGKESPVYRIPRGSPLYKMMERYFDVCWDDSPEASKGDNFITCDPWRQSRMQICSRPEGWTFLYTQTK